MSEENDSVGGKILKGALVTLGVGLAAYTVYHVAKEYDAMVDQYNDMVDKYNKNIDFINSCDFYEVKKDAPEEFKDAARRNDFTEVKDFVDEGGASCRETFDPVTGFSVCEVTSDDSSDCGENDKSDGNDVSESDFTIL